MSRYYPIGAKDARILLGAEKGKFWELGGIVGEYLGRKTASSVTSKVLNYGFGAGGLIQLLSEDDMTGKTKVYTYNNRNMPYRQRYSRYYRRRYYPRRYYRYRRRY